MKMAMATVDTKIDYNQSARDLDARGRSAGNRGDPQGVRDRRQVPADFRDQGAHRTLARSYRRAGSDLFALDDEQRFHLRKAPILPNSTLFSPTCRLCASASITPGSAPCFRIRFGFGGTNATLVFKRMDA